MDTKTYAVEVTRTVSDKFYTETVRPPQLLANLLNFEFMARSIDVFKKAIFYGKPVKPVAEVGPLTYTDYDQDELHFLTGIITEAGEISEVLRAQWALKPEDRDNVKIKDEVGDILWYIQNLLNKRGLTLDEVMESNINKLRARFPEKFDEAAAINRNESAEEAALKV